jgi:peptidoglycan/LPS O-acetylase OafA/YrhL
MPEPAERGQRYVPGLDGLRAIAVLAVIAYHLNLSWAPGGLLGVGVFFTLSGYLITDLLLTRYDSVGRLDLGQFWLRRARRLLPALLAMLIVVTAWTTVWHPSRLSSLRSGVFAALGYVSNWQLIGQHISYFAQFGPPSPLGHLWSLAIEEQFYLIWPWLLMLGLWLEARRGHDSLLRGRLALYTLGLAAVSALLMAVLYHPGFATTRV